MKHERIPMEFTNNEISGVRRQELYFVFSSKSRFLNSLQFKLIASDMPKYYVYVSYMKN